MRTARRSGTPSTARVAEGKLRRRAGTQSLFYHARAREKRSYLMYRLGRAGAKRGADRAKERQTDRLPERLTRASTGRLFVSVPTPRRSRRAEGTVKHGREREERIPGRMPVGCTSTTTLRLRDQHSAPPACGFLFHLEVHPNIITASFSHPSTHPSLSFSLSLTLSLSCLCQDRNCQPGADDTYRLTRSSVRRKNLPLSLSFPFSLALLVGRWWS